MEEMLKKFHDSDQPGHGTQSLLTDANLMRWALVVNGYLMCITHELGCETLEQLMEMVQRNKWFPTGSEAAVDSTSRLLFRVYDLCFAAKEEHECIRYLLNPPNRPSVLLCWKIMVPFLQQRSPDARKQSLSLAVDTSDLKLPSLQMPTVDAHCHADQLLRNHKITNLIDLLFEEFWDSRVDCDYILCSLAFPSSWRELHSLESRPVIYFQMGIHPHKTGRPVGEKTFEELKALIRHPKCVAIGEVGLDYQHSEEELVCQREFLGRIVTYAATVQKPLVIHARKDEDQDAVYAEVILLLKDRLDSSYPVYLHCFSGTVSLAQMWLTCFPNTHFGLGRGVIAPSSDVDQMIMEIPQDQILLETDAPHGLKHPWALQPVIDRVAKLKNLCPLMVGALTKMNAIRFFNLPYKH
jgi:TatD DNase family protein